MSPSRGKGRPRGRKNIYGRLRTRSGSRSSLGRGPNRNRYAHIGFAVLVLAVVVFVFTRDESDPLEATTSTTDPTVTATTETAAALPDPTRPTTTTIEEPEAPITSTTVPSLEGPTLNESAAAFVDGLGEIRIILAQLVSEISAANQAWDNRDETGARFEDAEAAISGVVERTRALAETTRNLPVPPNLADRHQGPRGPAERAAALVPLAEAVLDGLRLPSPDDGSTRREALADFVSASEVLTSSIDELIRFVQENAQDSGLTVAESPPTTTATATTTTTHPPGELSGEAVAYVNDLMNFKQAVTDLAALAIAANRDWDNTGETGVTYRETAAALDETINRARSFHEQVGDLPAPEALRTLGSGPVQHAARLPTLAEAMLEGLRLPAPEDGSVRRAALADFVAAAEDFAASVDNLVAYIEENAESLGLVE